MAYVKYGFFMRLDTHGTGVVAGVCVTPPIKDTRAFLGEEGSQHHDLEQNCRGTQAARQSPIRRGLSAWVLSHRARKDTVIIV
jgi:hypothetical protein